MDTEINKQNKANSKSPCGDLGGFLMSLVSTANLGEPIFLKFCTEQ